MLQSTKVNMKLMKYENKDYQFKFISSYWSEAEAEMLSFFPFLLICCLMWQAMLTANILISGIFCNNIVDNGILCVSCICDMNNLSWFVIGDTGWAWWYMTIITVLRKLSQEYHKFESKLSYMERTCNRGYKEEMEESKKERKEGEKGCTSLFSATVINKIMAKENWE